MYLYRLVFKNPYQGYSAGEGAAFPFEEAVRLVGGRLCEIADDEPEREALSRAVAKYRKPTPDPFWLAPCVSERRGGVGRPWRSGSRFGPVKP